MIGLLEKQHAPYQPKLLKSEEEWKALLTSDEYAILRGKETETASSGEYDRYFPGKQEGHFACRACKQARLHSVASVSYHGHRFAASL